MTEPVTPAAPPLQPWRSPLVRTVLWVEAVVLLCVALGLWFVQQQKRAFEARVLQVLAAAVAERIDDTLEAAEATLAFSVADLKLAASEHLHGTRAGVPADLLARVLALPMFYSLAVVDSEGLVLAAADEIDSLALPQRITLLRQASTYSFALSPALVVTDKGTKRKVLAASMPWHSADGRSGLMVALTEFEYFTRAFRQLSPERAAVLSLWNDDGSALSDTGGDGDYQRIATLFRESRIDRMGVMPTPIFNGTSQNGMLVLQPLPRQPFVVAAALGRDPVLASWGHQELAVGLLTLLGLAFALAMAWRSAQHLERTRLAQLAARESADRLAARIQSTGKMEALGTLSGGIAHDFNNLLAAIIGYGEMARDAASPGTTQARHIDQVLQAGQRGKALVERILAFSRPGARPHSHFVAQLVVQEVLGLLRGALNDRLRLHVQLEAPAAQLNGDPTLLFEAVMNLCTNALHAMPQGGDLHLTLDLLEVDEPWTLSHGVAAAGRHLRLRVVDSGSGITPEVLPRIFEPFFSTRSAADNPQGGTGLGLAVVHGAVTDLGGAIDVQTVPEQGSTFTLMLPTVDPKAQDDHVLGSDAEDLPLGQGQIVLLVDDEPALVALGEELLAALGYEPVGFASAQTALDAIQREPQRFDLLLTDQVMTGMSGLELTQAVMAIHPNLPVLLATGYGGSDFEAKALLAGVTQVLAKPLTKAQLARALDSALRHALGRTSDASYP